ncbi:carbon-nitrogen hydrolase family protein [Streptomyces sp. NPDC000880]
MSTVRIAAAQLPACAEDPSANLAAVRVALHDAARAGAAVVVLPELATVPYFAAEPAGVYDHWAQPVPGPLTDEIGALGASLGITVILPLFEYDPSTGTRHNAAVVLREGRIVPAVDRGGKTHHVARKLHLPVGDDPPPGFDEPAHFTPGEWLGVHDLGTLRLSTLICYDRRFPECWREARSLGADLVAVPVAGSGGDSSAFFLGELCTHARENGLFAVAANKVGTEWVAGKAVDNFGESAIVGPDGELLAHRREDEGPGLVIADLDLDLLALTRERLRYFEHRRTDLFPGPPSPRS